MQIEQHLRELELELLRPAARRSEESLSSLLAAEFREFGSSGRVFSAYELMVTPARVCHGTFRHVA